MSAHPITIRIEVNHKDRLELWCGDCREVIATTTDSSVLLTSLERTRELHLEYKDAPAGVRFV